MNIYRVICDCLGLDGTTLRRLLPVMKRLCSPGECREGKKGSGRSAGQGCGETPVGE